ncbi:hypothetical protein [Pseudofrankia sp. BMG5.37]|uniref:hypothetical protein n=1 Tax=Pseudofrankia sp. BMG5.37 TaxID=3050035 RepID=UPI0028946C07|nr:hypothetical protein [Pseudofrankia sp. BMG5.37]MDT3445759.1 hypothetical protein [Pseudofrankia sp. BMG5.37]
MTTRPRVEAPLLPDEAQPELLDLEVRKELRSLPTGLAEVVARHLVAAAMFLDDDPALALAHGRAAASLAARLPATREAAGIAAYHAGEYATALVELRTARRMDGSPRYLPMIADAERGLGRPERAIAYLSDPSIETLDPAGHAELLMVGSGARRDLGQPEAAVVLLHDEATRPGEPRPWTARLRYAYAEALLDAGRPGDALRAFEAAAAIDEEDETDANERAYELMTQLAAQEATSADEPVAARTPASGAAASSADETDSGGVAPSGDVAPGGAGTPSQDAAGGDVVAGGPDVAISDEASAAVSGEASAVVGGEPSAEGDPGPGDSQEANGAKGVAPVLFDDGSSSLALLGTGEPAAAEAEPARREAARPGGLPDLSVLFSGLGLREIPAAERLPLGQEASAEAKAEGPADDGQVDD